MLKSHLNLALRVLQRNKAYTAIHLVGLTLGVGGCMLLLALLRFEYSYDHAFPDHERIYRFTHYWTQGGETTHRALTPEPLAPYLLAEVPDVEAAVRIQRTLFSDAFPLSIRIGEERFQQGNGVAVADPSIFETLGLETLSHNEDVALAQPASVVLSQSLARKLFGDQDPVGQVVMLDDGEGVPFEVTGVLPDQPRNTSLRFEMIFSLGDSSRELGGFGDDDWGHRCCETYVKLREGASPDRLQESANTLLATYQGDMVTRFDQRLALQPLEAIHLHTLDESGLLPTPRLRFLQAALACAVFILVIACMSFIGLTVSAHNQRLKNIAIRRAFGAHRTDLFLQIGAEVAVLFAFAYVLSAVAATGGTALWNRFASGYVVLPEMTLTDLGLWMVLMAGLGGVCALAIGLQVLSVSAVETLAGRGLPSTMGRRLSRPYALGVQLAISVMLLMLAVIALKQLAFIRALDWGFEPEDVMVVEMRDMASRSHVIALRDEMARLPGVRAASASSGVPGRLGWRMLFRRRAADRKQIQGFALLADAHFLPLYGIASGVPPGHECRLVDRVPRAARLPGDRQYWPAGGCTGRHPGRGSDRRHVDLSPDTHHPGVPGSRPHA